MSTGTASQSLNKMKRLKHTIRIRMIHWQSCVNYIQNIFMELNHIHEDESETDKMNWKSMTAAGVIIIVILILVGLASHFAAEDKLSAHDIIKDSMNEDITFRMKFTIDDLIDKTSVHELPRTMLGLEIEEEVVEGDYKDNNNNIWIMKHKEEDCVFDTEWISDNEFLTIFNGSTVKYELLSGGDSSISKETMSNDTTMNNLLQHQSGGGSVRMIREGSHAQSQEVKENKKKIQIFTLIKYYYLNRKVQAVETGYFVHDGRQTLFNLGSILNRHHHEKSSMRINHIEWLSSVMNGDGKENVTFFSFLVKLTKPSVSYILIVRMISDDRSPSFGSKLFKLPMDVYVNKDWRINKSKRNEMKRRGQHLVALFFQHTSYTSDAFSKELLQDGKVGGSTCYLRDELLQLVIFNLDEISSDGFNYGSKIGRTADVSSNTIKYTNLTIRAIEVRKLELTLVEASIHLSIVSEKSSVTIYSILTCSPDNNDFKCFTVYERQSMILSSQSPLLLLYGDNSTGSGGIIHSVDVIHTVVSDDGHWSLQVFEDVMRDNSPVNRNGKTVWSSTSSSSEANSIAQSLNRVHKIVGYKKQKHYTIFYVLGSGNLEKHVDDSKEKGMNEDVEVVEGRLDGPLHLYSLTQSVHTLYTVLDCITCKNYPSSVKNLIVDVQLSDKFSYIIIHSLDRNQQSSVQLFKMSTMVSGSTRNSTSKLKHLRTLYKDDSHHNRGSAVTAANPHISYLKVGRSQLVKMVIPLSKMDLRFDRGDDDVESSDRGRENSPPILLITSGEDYSRRKIYNPIPYSLSSAKNGARTGYVDRLAHLSNVVSVGENMFPREAFENIVVQINIDQNNCSDVHQLRRLVEPLMSETKKLTVMGVGQRSGQLAYELHRYVQSGSSASHSSKGSAWINGLELCSLIIDKSRHKSVDEINFEESAIIESSVPVTKLPTNSDYKPKHHKENKLFIALERDHLLDDEDVKDLMLINNIYASFDRDSVDGIEQLRRIQKHLFLTMFKFLKDECGN